MPVLTILAHGSTCGVAPALKTTQIPERLKTNGWSTAATRRNTAFLRSINHDSLTGDGFALTLTLRNCPETPESWHSTRANFIKRLKRRSLLRLHWVVEWQRRGVPHLHIAAWFDEEAMVKPDQIIEQWLLVAKDYKPAQRSQTAVPIHAFGGWAQYVSKHAARGAAHYQRNIASLPTQWRSTGRVWGKSGQWSQIDPKRLEMAPTAFYAYRRLIRKFKLNKAKRTGTTAEIHYAKNMLKCHEKGLSAVRGVSEWVPSEVNLAIVNWLIHAGFSVLVGPTTKIERITERLKPVQAEQEGQASSAAHSARR